MQSLAWWVGRCSAHSLRRRFQRAEGERGGCGSKRKGDDTHACLRCLMDCFLFVVLFPVLFLCYSPFCICVFSFCFPLLDGFFGCPRLPVPVAPPPFSSSWTLSDFSHPALKQKKNVFSFACPRDVQSCRCFLLPASLHFWCVDVFDLVCVVVQLLCDTAPLFVCFPISHSACLPLFVGGFFLLIARHRPLSLGASVWFLPPSGFYGLLAYVFFFACSASP